MALELTGWPRHWGATGLRTLIASADPDLAFMHVAVLDDGAAAVVLGSCQLASACASLLDGARTDCARGRLVAEAVFDRDELTWHFVDRDVVESVEKL